MKKIFMYFIVVTFLFFTPVIAAADYVQTLDVYQYSVGGSVGWSHTYDFSQTPPFSAYLIIVADDVDGPNPAVNGDDGENDEVWFNGHFLGYLNQMTNYTNWAYSPGAGNAGHPDAITTTVFNLNPTWLAANMPSSVKIEDAWGVEIETSTLRVSNVPEPTTMLLLGLGLIGLAGVRRKIKK
jgi:hypothetical protein